MGNYMLYHDLINFNAIRWYWHKNVHMTCKSFLPLKKWNTSRARFRSSDLWVMGPARFHCATLLHIPQLQKAIHKSRRIMSVLEERILIKESEMNRCSGKLKCQRSTQRDAERSFDSDGIIIRSPYIITIMFSDAVLWIGYTLYLMLFDVID